MVHKPQMQWKWKIPLIWIKSEWLLSHPLHWFITMSQDWSQTLTVINWVISLLMRSLRSAFFSLHLCPEYLWKIFTMVIIAFSRSEDIVLKPKKKTKKKRVLELFYTVPQCTFHSYTVAVKQFANDVILKIVNHI